ncbi:hypothetical protein NX843_28750, partial [Burkholderia thailandensis]|nr:hypothetical protein [Burkholderia thailandensis]
RCRLSLGGKQLISSPFCSASDSPPPSTETFNRPQHTKFLTRPKHSVQVHFPPGGPRQDPDPYKTDAYLCVIFRNLETVELAFAPGSSKCWDK